MMTLGEKLKDVRGKLGLSQEQLAQKLCVSRQAVAKWEADRGLPDIINLKALAALLDVSVDDLLDDGETESLTVMKEAVDWSRYPKEKWNNLKEDYAVLERYSDAVSSTQLSRKKRRTRTEKMMDTALFFLTPLPDNMSQVYDGMRDAGVYYLVEYQEKSILVKVTEEFVISCRLPQKHVEKTIEIGEDIFRKTRRRIL